MKKFSLSALLLLFLGVAACGPVVGGLRIVDANIALSAAETAGAKSQAVYEYTAATEYLNKAREEHAYSDFAAARRYAEKAYYYALEARKKAEMATRVRLAPTPVE